MSIIDGALTPGPDLNLSLGSSYLSDLTKPSSILDTSSALKMSTSIFSNNTPLVFNTGKVTTVPTTSNLEVTAINGQKVTAPASSAGESFFSGFLKDLSTAALNLGSNVLLSKYGTKPTTANTTSPANTAGTVPTDGKTPVEIFDAGANRESALEAILAGLLGQHTSNENVPAQPSQSDPSFNWGLVLLIVVAVIVIVLILRK